MLIRKLEAKNIYRHKTVKSKGLQHALFKRCPSFLPHSETPAESHEAFGVNVHHFTVQNLLFYSHQNLKLVIIIKILNRLVLDYTGASFHDGCEKHSQASEAWDAHAVSPRVRLQRHSSRRFVDP